MQEETKCRSCGYTTNRHLIHTEDGKCYCVAHYLIHYLNTKREITINEESL